MRLCTIRTKGGHRLQVAIALTRAIDRDGHVYGVSIIEDFGPRIVAERRLAMLESVVVNSMDAVILLEATPDELGRRPIIFVNDAFTRMTGYSAAEALGKTLEMLHGPKTSDLELKRIRQAMLHREPVITELANYRKDGSEFWIEFHLARVTDAAGSCKHFIGTARDITQRRAIEQLEFDRGVVLEIAVRNEPLDTQLAWIVVLLKNVIPGSLLTLSCARKAGSFHILSRSVTDTIGDCATGRRPRHRDPEPRSLPKCCIGCALLKGEQFMHCASVRLNLFSVSSSTLWVSGNSCFVASEKPEANLSWPATHGISSDCTR